MAAAPLVDSDLYCRHVVVAPQDVVMVKSIFEASEGLGVVFAERGGDLLIAAPHSRAAELDELLHDLETDLNARIENACTEP